MQQHAQHTHLLIKQTATALGFSFCGIAKAEELTQEAKKLEAWLHNGFHASMQYMENYFDLRINPQKLVPGAKTVITLLKNYYPSQQPLKNQYKVSKYALGQDYHTIIKNQLHQFYQNLQQQLGNFTARGFVDSAPVLERAWAVKAGLGWVGKNGNLINKQQGSFFFIATLITDLNTTYDDAFAKDFCGTCTKCIDACPTAAILPNKVVDGSKCISYFTIELKDALIDETHKGKFDNWMFGCDTCQDVCPWNRFSQPHQEKGFEPIPQLLNFSTKDWEDLTEEKFKIIFKDSALKRSKFAGIKRNLKFLQSNKNNQ
jgi:epoxyqueuosine reductase